MQINLALGLSCSAIKFWRWGAGAAGAGLWGLAVPPVPPTPPYHRDGHRLGVPLQSPRPPWEPPKCLGQVTRGRALQRHGLGAPLPLITSGFGRALAAEPSAVPPWQGTPRGEEVPGKSRNLTQAIPFPRRAGGEGPAPSTKPRGQPGQGGDGGLRLGSAGRWPGPRHCHSR